MTNMQQIETIIEKAILVGVNLQNDPNFHYSMEELSSLAEALDVTVMGDSYTKFRAGKSIPLCRNWKN